MAGEHVIHIKSIIVGDFAVGKTSLCKKYATGMFSEDYKPTLGVDIFTRRLDMKGFGVVILSIWDTAGQEKFRRMYPRYYKGAKYAIVVYDITSKDTFESISLWIEEIRKHAGDIPILLVGNKADLVAYREVSEEEGEKKVKELNLIGFLETSARTGKNVNDVFEMPISYVLKSIIKDKNNK